MRLWDRQPDEIEKAYSAFKQYLEMPNRNLKKLAETLHISRQTLSVWARKYDWKSRVAAYDSANFEGLRKTNLNLKIMSIERKNFAAGKLEEKAMKALEAISLNRVSVRGVVEMLTLANQLRNEAAEIEMQSDEDKDISITIRGV